MDYRKFQFFLSLLFYVNIVKMTTTTTTKNNNYSVLEIDRQFSNNISSINCAFETLLTDGDYLICRQNYNVYLNLNYISFLLDDVPYDTLRAISNVTKLGFVDINFNNFNVSLFDNVLNHNLEGLIVKNCRFNNVIVYTNEKWGKLRTLEFSGNYIDGDVRVANSFRFSSTIPNLHTLRLTGNKFHGSPLVAATTAADIIRESTSLERIDFRNNGLRFVPRLPNGLLSLEIMENSISHIEDGTFDNTTSLKLLNFSYNSLITIKPGLLSTLIELETLDLSNNLIISLESDSFRFLASLKVLILRNNPLNVLPQRFPALINLQYIDLSQTGVQVLLLETLTELSGLKTLKLDNSKQLRSIVGKIARDSPKLQELSAKSCSLKTLPADIFRGASKLVSVDLSDNPWPCDCRLTWTSQLSPIVKFSNENLTFCYSTDKGKLQLQNFTTIFLNISQCNLGTVFKNGTIVRVRYGQSALLDCGAYGGNHWPTVTWRRADTNSDIESINRENSGNGGGQLIEYQDGTLSVSAVYREEVGLYQCSISSNDHGNVTLYVKLRLAYAETWWFIKISSLICGILTALGFFALNVITGAIRRLVVWRLSKLEQTSRVRCLLESMEKYRQRQMDYLHEIYSSNMNQVRENYHQQVEQLRKSYSAQAGRFRDYRAAQMESVSQHIDSMRDNYATQMNRMRDYGSRQMERLWESYQRRVGRLRDFSLQQRLRLMQHYKIKQHYLNKLLENLNMESCRHPGRRPSRNVIGPESIELPPILPDTDLPTSTAFDRRDSFLVGGSQSYLDDDFTDGSMLRSSNSLYNYEQQKFVVIDDDDDDDASSYHSFPEDISLYVEEKKGKNNYNKVANMGARKDSSDDCAIVHSAPKFTKETAL